MRRLLSSRDIALLQEERLPIPWFCWIPTHEYILIIKTHQFDRSGVQAVHLPCSWELPKRAKS